MQEWQGASGVCINENGQILMVLQGKPDEKKTWSIPSGGRESNETFEQCCIREVAEETGYKVEIVRKLQVKKKSYDEANISIEVHYFLVRLLGGTKTIQDPDNLIYDIAWKSIDEIQDLELTFPEDRSFLKDYLVNIV
ncbi:NUDIX hydrolase [Lysinibacillus sp. SGAir0095]|uniref:NUDIX hydrolase n=1 Tax=Lysinibacillus sp. SGAir0095 TaxID=2070463 RepID=UPI0010CD073C|nr:NUDIX hydrolase [Lysinibacillus sp. SGAir0095]QCR31180.1 DNA mismatch repair protein MutT [Lysinibacillus sp. SGAir0095]